MTISTLLVANRGEIAIRVIRGARSLGIRTVAVYSDADRFAPHVREADVAVHIGGTPAAESYLNIDALLGAAAQSGADAVHPGYGFLSERASFASAAVAAGLTWVGPPAEVIERMGRKDAAREIAIAAGVPVVPRGEDAGFPMMVKAAAGGGGKGMRIVRTEADLAGAIDAAKREAASAFGDDTLLIERYVEHGRHIEVQILADQHGTVVHLRERDCSAQRRHQKVIEEAPAPGLPEPVRKVLLDSAVALAAEVGYTNAGTVEFLVSGDEVFFLEMNTRLQVEHPVTEAITGLDLVQLQLRIAEGALLPFSQDDVTCTGHAIEARVYAEDAFGGFLPQAGVARTVRWPRRARVDAALESGQAVTTAYDPMLGKIIVHAPTREAARQQLIAALDDTAVLGLVTNAGFLRALVSSDPFRDQQVDTSWLDHHADLIAPPARQQALAHAAQAVLSAARTDDSPFGAGDGWRLTAAPVRASIVLDDDIVDAQTMEVDGHPALVEVSEYAVDLAFSGQWFTFARPQASRTQADATADGVVVAPMPGTVIRIEAAEGDHVDEGDLLAVMEAMKMELTLKAPFAGTVTLVGAAAGSQVPLKHPLFEVTPDA